MSEVYSIEPKTHGKVIIYTSLGELEVWLFSNECPIACQNFIQLCLNNYYNNNKFFRVIPKFLIQTGDHTNTGLHNEYAFKEPFKNEYNSRLKFLYMGCLSFANLNIDTPSNGSQFFITLDKVESLNNKSTLFGKVAKHSLYNLLKFNNIKTNKNDEPIEDVPCIEHIKIIENPFHHLVPFANYDEGPTSEKRQKQEQELGTGQMSKVGLKSNLLSFTGDGSDDSDAVEAEAHDDEEKSVKREVQPVKQSFGEQLEQPVAEQQSQPVAEQLAQQVAEQQAQPIAEQQAQPIAEQQAQPIAEQQAQTIADGERDSLTAGSNKRKTNEEKVNMLKEKTNDIEKSKRKKIKSALAIRHVADLDEAYLKRVKKYSKMSKREREKESLKKLEEFDNRLKNLFCSGGTTDTTPKDGDVKHEWIHASGLKFRVDSSNAYEFEDIKKSVETLVVNSEGEKKKTYDSKFSIQHYLKKKRERHEHGK
ncbi:peptidyl-prolyl cis-trans isomerase, putative (CYP52) [Plasmodium ovale curtisi]|uniref:Peptidyl-prolyl cis-trans isomerase, putative (CYP52) n=1 Tax=Plasmodium ovale curtisi TaxID=864141 RepID=A0A1A8WBT6_PLAOA|nr:peptidyl-prolyl cis-trans isomerase, putative (CYP52) [Plasmodium ovale curtisi]